MGGERKNAAQFMNHLAALSMWRNYPVNMLERQIVRNYPLRSVGQAVIMRKALKSVMRK